MRSHHSLLTALGVLALASAAHCQVVPSDMDRTQMRPSARALGMGGTDLIITDDASGAAFNPASISQAGRGSIAADVQARTSNLNVSKVNKVVNDLKDFRDQANNNNINNTVSAVQNSFNELYDFAQGAGANTANGAPARINATLAPLLGFSVGAPGGVSGGLLYYGGAQADVRLLAQSFPTGRLLQIDGGALVLQNIAVPIALPTTSGTVGISLKSVQANYTGISAVADERTNAVSSTVFGESNQRKFDVDLGYTSAPAAVTGIRYAAVVHNLLSPSFHLQSPTGPNGSPASRDFSFSMKPQIDAGLLAPIPGYKGLQVAAEVHNLNGVNGGKKTFHLGGELQTSQSFAVRLGYDNQAIVAGIGLSLGDFRIDVATSTRPQERLSIGSTLRF